MKRINLKEIGKKIAVFAIAAVLCLCCGCSNTGDDSSSSSQPSSTPSTDNSSSQPSSTVYDKDSQKPTITVASQVGNGVCVVAGYCSKETEKIIIKGNYTRSVETVPFDGGDYKYFIAQITYTSSTTLKVSAVEPNANESEPASAFVGRVSMSTEYMYKGEYSPVFCKNGQMHFYSSLLSYSLDTSKLTPSMVTSAYKSVQSIVAESKKLGAETIFVIIPSSADIYPETVPEEFKAASGERLFERFSQIARESGAKVIYPISTMKEHSNDGAGLQIYQHTDSHWSAYGAYWGTYELFDYIAQKFPSAKPRTVSEMGFYTTVMDGGDSLFSFPSNLKFEDYQGDRTTKITKIKELTNLYTLKMPTSTLEQAYWSNKCLTLNDVNSAAGKFSNPNGKGLPTALIMRDSFSKVSYDMMNDRFKTVYWGEFNNYNMPLNIVDTDKVDYVIYIYSERNLMKIMMNNSSASILNLK